MCYLLFLAFFLEVKGQVVQNNTHRLVIQGFINFYDIFRAVPQVLHGLLHFFLKLDLLREISAPGAPVFPHFILRGKEYTLALRAVISYR